MWQDINMNPLDHELLREHYTPEEAISLQERWRQGLAMQANNPRFPSVQNPNRIRFVAGVDVSYPKTPVNAPGVASAVVWDVAAENVVTSIFATGEASFPYIPGLLGFREARLLARAVLQRDRPVDLLLCDGHGIAHPRRFGLAVHVGVVLDIPSVGIAKTPYYGVGDWKTLPRTRGAKTGIYDPAPNPPDGSKGELLGQAVCLGDGRKPVFISAGYRTTLEVAVEVALRTTTLHRQPEPLFMADKTSREMVKTTEF